MKIYELTVKKFWPIWKRLYIKKQPSCSSVNGKVTGKITGIGKLVTQVATPHQRLWCLWMMVFSSLREPSAVLMSNAKPLLEWQRTLTPKSIGVDYSFATAESFTICCDPNNICGITRGKWKSNASKVVRYSYIQLLYRIRIYEYVWRLST